jgi:hypothetical protein
MQGATMAISYSYRSVAVLGVMALVTMVLSACSATPAPVSAADASASYPVVLIDVQSALRSEYPGVVWQQATTDEAEVVPDDDGCLLVLPTLRSDSSLWAEAGGWQAVMTVVNPVLEKHDFATVSSEDSLDGGWTGISSSDDHEAEIRFIDKDYTEISLSVPIQTEDCSAQQ